MKKLLSLLLAVAMMLGLCASASADPTHLTFSYIEFYPQDASERAAVVAALNEYLIPTYNLEVEFNPLQFSEFNSSFGTSVVAFDPYDVIPVFYSSVSGWFKAEALTDLTPYLETEDGKAIIDAIGEQIGRAHV